MKILSNLLLILKNTFVHWIIFYLICLYLWIRFVRERMPRDIPFDLSILGFFILIYICCIYFFIVYMHIRKNKESVIAPYIRLLYKPLEDFDDMIKDLSLVKKYYPQIIVFFSNKILYLFEKSILFYCIFMVVPRIILVSFLILDIFCFHKLNLIYDVVLFGLIVLGGKYLIYTIKKLKDELIEKYSKNYGSFILDCYLPEYLDLEDEDDDDDDDDDIFMHSMAAPFDIFIKIYVDRKVYANLITDYTISWSKEHYQEIADIYEISPKELVGNKYSKYQRERENKNIIKKILTLALIVGYYEFYDNYSPFVKKLKILTFGSFFICWLYILIISSPSVDYITLAKSIENLYPVIEPFSQIPII